METSDWNHSYFSFWRSPSKVEVCGLQPEPDKYNFLSFLATAQALHIAFLPVIWDSTRQLVGMGGTSRVQDMLVSLETSLAFKINQKRNKTEEQIFRTLINEITILSQGSVKEHPNVARLQGICWDISSNDDIPWPVLVFEKSHLGDLEYFSRHEGRNITTTERLGLCIDIGRAVRDMHANSIVHGDIKPENVLVFQEESGQYRAKMIDFGYSGQYSDSNHLLVLFGTELWNAPEHRNRGRQWTLQEAIRADLFSFGMLCLWLLFEPSISGRVSLPQSPSLANIASSGSGFDTLSRLKESGALTFCARQQILSLTTVLEQGDKLALEEFFESTLNPEHPTEREIGLSGFLARFDARRNTQKAMLSNPEVATSLTSEDFKIEMSVYEFYRSDYRVRSYIVQRLQQCQPPSTHTAVQVAFCHYIGFGVRRSQNRAEEVLRQTGRRLEDVQGLIAAIHDDLSVYHTSTLSDLTAMGQVAWQDFTYTYLEQEKVEQAEMRLKQELDDLIVVFGEDHAITNLSRYVLAQVYLIETHGGPADGTAKAFKAAEQLLLQVIESNKANLIPDHPDTLIVTSMLASVYKSQFRWIEAKELELQVVATSRAKLGLDHPFTLTMMSNLSSTYTAQGQLKDAEQVDMQVVEACKTTGRVNNPSMLTSITNLVLTYQSQGRWEDVARLNMQVLKMHQEKLGEGHPDTINSLAGLARTYQAQGKLEEAKEHSSRALKLSKDRYGTENIDTLRHMCHLASIFWEQSRFDEVEKLQARVVEARKTMLGAAHPETLQSKLNLASAIRKQGRLEESKEVERQLLETCKASLVGNRANKAKVLGSMCDLASVFWGSGRVEDAEELELEIVEAYKSELGIGNPLTIRRITYLASRYKDQDRWEEAQEFFTQAIAANTNSLGADHDNTLRSISDLAKLYEKRCQWNKAEELHLQLVEKRKALLGEDSLDTLSSMHDLAFCYGGQERWEEAGELYWEVMEKRKILLGEGHPDTLITMYNLAITWKSDGWDQDALELLTECSQIRQRVFGDSDPDVVLDLETLNEWTD